MRRSPSILAGRTVVYALLITAAVFTLIPMVWLVAAAFKSPDDLFTYTFFPPVRQLSVANFVDLFKKMPFFRDLMNSTFIATTTVIVQLFFSSLAGFALAKYEFKGKRLLMVMMLATMLIPAQVTMAPLYELIYHLGLVDTYPGIIIPGAISVFGIFLFRQSMLQVPTELIHAARIDGCTEFRIYRDVVMPVSRPMVGAFCLISFMASWNSFLWPQILLHSSSRFTLPIGLTQLVGLYGQDYGTMLAGTLLSVLPVVVLFMLLQKEFVAGLTAGAVKG